MSRLTAPGWIARSWRPIVAVLCLLLLVWMVHEAGPQRLWLLLCQMPLTVATSIAVWGIAYLVNAQSFRQVLLGVGERQQLPAPGYGRTLQLTISGYALNYVTPFGLLGGEPYRVAALSPWMPTRPATSAVGLYSMAHIASHVVFWLLSLAWAAYSLGWLHGEVATAAITMAGIATLFDPRQLAPRRQVAAVALELLSRLICVVEYWLVMQALGLSHLGYGDALLVVAFSSLLANILFFSPLQMGTREGGICLAMGYLLPDTAPADVLALSVALSFATRIREFTWIAIGTLLMLGKKSEK